METLTKNELSARIERFMSKVVFKGAGTNSVSWFWLGRPERYADHTAEQGVKSLRYVLY